MVRAIAVVTTVIATTAGCSAVCEPQQLVDCADCGPGQLRRVLAFPTPSTTYPAAVSANTVVCMSCNDVWSYGADGTSTQTAIDLGSTTTLSSAAVAADGTAYIVGYAGGPVDDCDPPPPPTLVAIDPTGRIGWENQLGGSASGDVVAGTRGAFATSFAVNGGIAQVVAYAADTGAVQWQAELDEATVAADLDGGLFVATFGGSGTAHVYQLDASGSATGPAHDIVATGTTQGNLPLVVSIDAMAATPDGGLLVAGFAIGQQLDFGDRTIPLDGEFVAAFDASGATSWVDASIDPQNIQIAPTGDGALIAGNYVGDSGGVDGLTNTPGVVMARYDATGMTGLYEVSGAAALFDGLASAPGSAAWIAVTDGPVNPGMSTELEVAGQSFDNGGDISREFLFQLAL